MVSEKWQCISCTKVRKRVFQAFDFLSLCSAVGFWLVHPYYGLFAMGGEFALFDQEYLLGNECLLQFLKSGVSYSCNHYLCLEW